MAKRFTDTDKWKGRFMKGLEPKYKLLWLYIIDDCNHAGVWIPDIEIAEMRTGEKFNINEALKAFGDNIIPIEDGDVWFIPSFLETQYGTEISKKNNIFKSLDKEFSRYKLHKFITIDITETGTTISAIRGRLSQKLKDKIFLESEFVCQYCSEQKAKAELVVDHFVPLTKGGDNSDNNLICCCIRCNSHKSDIMPDIFLSSGLTFLNPSERLKALVNSLKGGYNVLPIPQEQEQRKDKVKEQKPEVISEIDIWTVPATILKKDSEWWNLEILRKTKLPPEEIDFSLTQYWLWKQTKNHSGEENSLRCIRSGFQKWLNGDFKNKSSINPKIIKKDGKENQPQHGKIKVDVKL